jgi:hypothetical protein
MNQTTKTILFVLLSTSVVSSAQSVGVGLKIGTLLSDALSPKNDGTNHALVIGPSVELRLPVGLSIEADALYQSGELDSLTPGASRWQFPIVAKHDFLKGPLRPYVEGGLSFSHLTDLKDIPGVIHSSNYGFVLGAGLDFKLLFFRVSSEVRYNVWAFKDIINPSSNFDQKRGQALLLVGFGF